MVRVRKTKVKKRRQNRRHTMRGGFRDVKDACDQIAAAPDETTAKKIYRKATIQFHPDKPSGSTEAMQELLNCFDKKTKADEKPFEYEGPPAEPVPEPEPVPPPPKPKPAPKPQRPRAEPGPPPAPAPAPTQPPQQGNFGVIIVPKGSVLSDDSFSGFNEEEMERIKYILAKSFETQPIAFINYLLENHSLTILTLDAGVTEQALIDEISKKMEEIGEKLTQQHLDELKDRIVEMFPDFTLPTKERFDIVIVS